MAYQGVKMFRELTPAQKKAVKERFDPPYGQFLYKITQAGKVQYRQRKMRR